MSKRPRARRPEPKGPRPLATNLREFGMTAADFERMQRDIVAVIRVHVADPAVRERIWADIQRIEVPSASWPTPANDPAAEQDPV